MIFFFSSCISKVTWSHPWGVFDVLQLLIKSLNSNSVKLSWVVFGCDPSLSKLVFFFFFFFASNHITTTGRRLIHQQATCTNKYHTEWWQITGGKQNSFTTLFFLGRRNLASSMEEPWDCDRSPTVTHPCVWSLQGRTAWQRDTRSIACWAWHASSGPRSTSWVTPDAEASVCEAALRAYLEQLVMRHSYWGLILCSVFVIFVWTDEGPHLSSSCNKIQPVTDHISRKTGSTLLGHAISHFCDPRRFSTMLNSAVFFMSSYSAWQDLCKLW